MHAVANRIQVALNIFIRELSCTVAIEHLVFVRSFLQEVVQELGETQLFCDDNMKQKVAVNLLVNRL